MLTPKSNVATVLRGCQDRRVCYEAAEVPKEEITGRKCSVSPQLMQHLTELYTIFQSRVSVCGKLHEGNPIKVTRASQSNPDGKMKQHEEINAKRETSRPTNIR